jgi:hypothetical protein
MQYVLSETEGWGGQSAGERWTQSYLERQIGSTSNKMITPDSAHPDKIGPSNTNLLIVIDFDSPSTDLPCEVTVEPARRDTRLSTS